MSNVRRANGAPYRQIWPKQWAAFLGLLSVPKVQRPSHNFQRNYLTSDRSDQSDSSDNSLMPAFRKTAETFTSGAKTLAQRYLISPEVFAKEQERIFSTQWLCVG